jgi:hypothetical protein
VVDVFDDFLKFLDNNRFLDYFLHLFDGLVLTFNFDDLFVLFDDFLDLLHYDRNFNNLFGNQLDVFVDINNLWDEFLYFYNFGDFYDLFL